MLELDVGKSESQTRVEIWRPDVLFHTFKRFSNRGERVDRLRGIVERGIVPPLLDDTGKVVSDMDMMVEKVPGYNRTVFLHKYHPTYSQPYLPKGLETVCCFVNPSARVFTSDDAPSDWPVHSLDEVYVDGVIPPEELTGIAVYTEVIREIFEEFQEDLEKLRLPLYDFYGFLYVP